MVLTASAGTSSPCRYEPIRVTGCLGEAYACLDSLYSLIDSMTKVSNSRVSDTNPCVTDEANRRQKHNDYEHLHENLSNRTYPLHHGCTTLTEIT